MYMLGGRGRAVEEVAWQLHIQPLEAAKVRGMRSNLVETAAAPGQAFRTLTATARRQIHSFKLQTHLARPPCFSQVRTKRMSSLRGTLLQEDPRTCL